LISVLGWKPAASEIPLIIINNTGGASRTGFHAMTSPKGYEIVRTSWTGRHLRVTEDTADGPLAYSADLRTRKPHMLIQAEGTASLPTTVVFPSSDGGSDIIDISLDGDEDMPMRKARTSIWHSEFRFRSRAIGGMELTWRRPSRWLMPLVLECVDKTSGSIYARFNSHGDWSEKKAGRLEVLDVAASVGKALMDEIVVTVLAYLGARDKDG
jgi:hypothetical protein